MALLGTYRPTRDEYDLVDMQRDADSPVPLASPTQTDRDHELKDSTPLNPHINPPSPAKRAHVPDESARQAHNSTSGPYSGMPTTSDPRQKGPQSSRDSGWDVLAGIKRFEHSYEVFDSRNASESHLAYADGDIPKDKISKLYNYLLNVSIVTRWILFIVPVLGIIWIPGILGLTKFPDAHVWYVKLIWWSIWLSVVWGGWWAALATSRIGPHVTRKTVGLVAVGTRRYIDWLEVLNRYVALFAWTLAIWISWNPLIDHRQFKSATESARNTIDIIGKLLFALFLCAALLLFEKFSIQWIAGKFHERSYAERIADQKFAIRSLVVLYRHSVDTPGRTDTLRPPAAKAVAGIRPGRFFKKAMKGFQRAATTTTTALGNVASEIAGSSVLQPNSPQAVVKTALDSANKSRLLARRLFYSFVKPDSDVLFVGDIQRFFQTQDEADAVFALFDKDSNGDATRDEVEMACMEFHREQLSIEHSMQDLDSAVGRLDNILMSLYVVVAILIVAVALEAQLLSLVTGAGTLILGLSWLIGGSLQEVLTSIIFLFVKHPFDVGDRVNLAKDAYTVKEIKLLSTVFLDSNGTLVQAPNTELNKMFIQNIRRSSQQSETFKFDVHYSTTFEQLEILRERMLTFLKAERRDFQPSFDVVVVDFPEQEKMTLKADIKYKSNWQMGALKAKRRNKWICTLKSVLADCKIFGPTGDPDANPAKKYTLVPWEEVRENEQNAEQQQNVLSTDTTRPGGWKLSDEKAVIMQSSEDIFGETDELHMTNPRRGLSGLNSMASSSLAPVPNRTVIPTAQTAVAPPAVSSREHIEMSTV